MTRTRSGRGEEGKRVFATVGTTRFDQLVAALDSEVSRALRRLLCCYLSESGAAHVALTLQTTQAVQEALCERGFRSLVVQRGRSEVEPAQRSGMEVEVYCFKPSLAIDMQEADLVISHAGAGCIMESLRMGKRLIVVANESLMDNHQMELAHAMQARGYAAVATSETLSQVIREGADLKITPIPPLDNQDLMREMAALQVPGITWPQTQRKST